LAGVPVKRKKPFCGTPLGCVLFLYSRFRGFGEYASPPAILCAAVGGRGIAAFLLLQHFRFSIQDAYNLTIAALLYRSRLKNPPQNFPVEALCYGNCVLSGRQLSAICGHAAPGKN